MVDLSRYRENASTEANQLTIGLSETALSFHTVLRSNAANDQASKTLDIMRIVKNIVPPRCAWLFLIALTVYLAFLALDRRLDILAQLVFTSRRRHYDTANATVELKPTD